MSEDENKYRVWLELSGLEPDALVVMRMVGREEISRLFEFAIEVHPTTEPIFPDDFQGILDGTATISFGPDREHPIHGVVRKIEMLPTHDAERISYLLTVVPRFWDTHLTRGSWIYQDKAPRDIITSALTEILPESQRLEEDEHFEWNLSGRYTPREYVVQYEESVFDFVSRQAEHWGIFYFFDHLGEHEKVVFGDVNTVFPQLSGFETIRFEPVRGAANPDECIFELSLTHRTVGHQISLRDYNYRTPSVALVTPMQQIDEHGIGDVHVSHDHFWTPAEGSMVAGIRAQETFARKMQMRATSYVRGLRAGHHFTLQGETPEILGLAREYLVVAVDHEYMGAGGPSYQNHLTLIPREVAYRPARLTPLPHIYGIMHAKIDSETDDDGVMIPVDEWGRYKLLMPWDVAGQTGGRATCWVRLASASGGGGHGISAQLHVGVEVAVYHLGGNPDRPVIAGALPNFEQPPMVNRDNAHRTIIQTRGGSHITFSDQ